MKEIFSVVKPSPASSTFVDYQKERIREIGTAFRIPAVVMGDSSDYRFASFRYARQEAKLYYEKLGKDSSKASS